MSKIFLVNVGANTAHAARARSPIFPNGKFIYVPFPYRERDVDGTCKYPRTAGPFVRNLLGWNVHCDPDWGCLTYGDCCINRRAAALKKAAKHDILLFWALLWDNHGKGWQGFTGRRAWYLIGAIRIAEILKEGQSFRDAGKACARRAGANAHFYSKVLPSGHRVFIGSLRHSKRFPTAIPFHGRRSPSLLIRTVRSKDGLLLSERGKRAWNSATRACRPVWDLSVPEDYARARTVRDAIRRQIGYDLLDGIRPPARTRSS